MTDNLPKLVPITQCILLSGCDGGGIQSILLPEGPEAQRILASFWIMVAGGGAIVALVGMLITAALSGSSWRQWLAGESIVIAGGIAFPVLVLTALLVHELLLTRTSSAAPAETKLRISVVGEQWWWRIDYEATDGERFQTANEIRIPVGIPVAVELTSADVIHSFWVPKLAGKLDMIPGRKTHLNLQANEAGVSRGQCAEYCGGPHAFMSIYVVAMEENAFTRWLSQQKAAAILPINPIERRGSELFIAAGCGGCHAVRGTEAKGTIGPDLTHVGGRLSLAAATLPNNESGFARWIADNQHIKPENRMPPFRLFTKAELASLSAYLASLK
jgi:cytochrome c oxidase subunit 2